MTSTQSLLSRKGGAHPGWAWGVAELDQVDRNALEAMLRSSPDMSKFSVEEMRAAYDAGGVITPPRDDVAHHREDAAGVPVEIGLSAGADPSRSVLYLHGGGYIIGSTTSHRGLVARLGSAACSRTVSVEYRLAPEHPFPAAVDDALAAYRWLLDAGQAASSIVLAGDSAGGGLAVATLVRARDEGLPMPAAAALFSPLVDLLGEGESMVAKAAQDPTVDAAGHARFCAMYLAGAEPRSAYASPIHADLGGLPPLLIHVGTAEALLDDALRLARRAALDDVAVELKAWPRLPHVWQFYAGIFSEGQQSIDEAGRFLLAHLAPEG